MNPWAEPFEKFFLNILNKFHIHQKIFSNNYVGMDSIP